MGYNHTMKTSQYLILLVLGTLLGIGAWVAVVLMIDPGVGWPAMTMFLLTAGLWMFGGTAAVSTALRLRKHGEEQAHYVVPMSMRQASVLTVVFLLGLWLLAAQRLTLPVLVLLAFVAGVAEWSFAQRAAAKVARRG